ncbi:MAG: Fic family protein [Nitrospirota bacterium]
MPLLIRLAAIHYQFEAIHQFLDGNGRIGRLLIILLLCKEGALPEPLLYLSAYFERYRNEYYRLLLAVSQSDKWIDWISFFLLGVAEQSRDALARSGQLLRLWQEYREKFQSARSSALQLRLLDQLFVYPAITVNQAATLLKVTHRSAQLNIEKLVCKGILKEATGKQRNRVFVTPQIVKIIEAIHARSHRPLKSVIRAEGQGSG